jgi:uncharacterized protein
MVIDPIFLPQLAHALDQTDLISVNAVTISDLETLTPVQGQMKVVHHGNYLQVSATVETIVTLTCDRCLQSYNHRLATQASELIWLQEAVLEDVAEGVTFTGDLEDPALTETLPPNGYFYPEDWLYQQLCLTLPQRQLCDEQCPGIMVEQTQKIEQMSLDHRWSILADLKRQLQNGAS